MKKHSIQYNFIMNFILTASSLLFPLITFPYVSRIILPVGTGKVAFATSTVAYFTMAAMLGIPTYGIRAVARNRDDPVKLALTLKELLTINLIMSVISYAAFFVCLFLVPQMAREKTLMLVTSSAIILNVVGVNWFFQGLEEYSYITWVSVLFKVISVVTMFLFVRAKQDYIWYGVMTVLSSYGSGLVNLFRARRWLAPASGHAMNLRIHMKPVFIFFAMTVATTVYTNLDTVMLGFMKNDHDVGIYNAAIKIKTLLVTLVTSLGQVLLPRLSAYVSQGRQDEFHGLVAKAISFVLLFSVPVSLFCMVYARPVILLLSGSSYLPAVVPMVVLMPTLILIGLSNITGIQVLIPTGREKLVMMTVTAGAVTDLVLNLALIPGLGCTGAAFGTLAAETVVTAWQFWMLRSMLREIMPRVEWKQILLSWIAPLPALAVILIPMVSTMPSFFVLCIGAVLYFGFVFLVLVYSKEPILWGFLKSMVRNRI